MHFQIGNWILNSQTGNLTQGDPSAPMPENRLDHTPLALLLCLVKYHDQDVSKDTMLNEVWPNKVVTEDVLSVAISQIRKALGDNARKPSYIKTIPGIGYRLIADTNEVFEAKPPKANSITKVKLFSIPLLIIIATIGLLAWFLTSTQTSLDVTEQLSNLQDQNEYQKGRYLLTQKDQESWQEAQQIFEDTIITSPEFAPVYRELAEVKLKLIGYDDLAAYNKVEELKYLVNKSLELNPNDQQAYLMLADIAFSIEWDFESAERYFDKALELDPNNPTAHYRFSVLLMAAGKFDLAMQHVQRYIALDPKGYAGTMVAWIYNMMGRYDLAMQEMEKLQKLKSNDLMYLMSAHSILENTNNEQQSFDVLLDIFKLRQYTNEEINAATAVFNQDGLKGVNLWLLKVKKEQNNVGQGYPPLSLANYAIKAGEKDLAIKYLLEARDLRAHNLVFFNVDPKYKSIRQLPELKNILSSK